MTKPIERVPLRIILPPLCAALVACTPSPQDAAMRHAPSLPGSPPSPAQPGAAATGPVPEPVSAAENPAPVPVPSVDTPAAAQGRRILSTAFVRVGPDGYLTVTLRDGRVLALRDVVLKAGDYCGMPVSGKRHCGGYADVAAARPGGAPVAAPAADPLDSGTAVPGAR